MTKLEKLKAADAAYDVAYEDRYVTYDAYVAYMVAEAAYNAAYDAYADSRDASATSLKDQKETDP
jgi:hypothetical protein